jgi:hypothetical protein
VLSAEEASTCEAALRSSPSCAPSSGSTMNSPITITLPYGSSLATGIASPRGRMPTRMRPPSSGGSGNKLNMASTTLMINAFFRLSASHSEAAHDECSFLHDQPIAIRCHRHAAVRMRATIRRSCRSISAAAKARFSAAAAATTSPGLSLPRRRRNLLILLSRQQPILRANGAAHDSSRSHLEGNHCALQLLERGLTEFLNVVDAERELYAKEDERIVAQESSHFSSSCCTRRSAGVELLPPIREPEPAIVAMFRRLSNQWQ